jgi:hypothetical protein
VNTVARLSAAVCTVVIFGVFVADPIVSESDEPPSQPAAATPPQPAAQSPAEAPTGPTTLRAATPDPLSSGKPDTAAQPRDTATSSVTANAQPAANKSDRKLLVDDTVTDAQLKQILRKGYKPESQAHGNEVYYCRRELELGSHFETKICKTAAQILQQEQGGKEATTYVERTGAASEGARH